jgi:hypothetical protein
LYYFRLSDGTVSQLACEGTTDMGGDGSTQLLVSKSCASAKKYFGVVANKTFIDTSSPPSSAKAIQLYCLDGTSQGGNGSTSATSGASCTTLQTYFAKSAGVYYVGGSQT